MKNPRLKNTGTLLLPLALLLGASHAWADPDKNESGHKHHRHAYKHKGGEFKEEYWDGQCKVERKVSKKGEYKEERKCPAPYGHGPVVYTAPLVYLPAAAPVYVPPPAHAEPGVFIHGTVRVR